MDEHDKKPRPEREPGDDEALADLIRRHATRYRASPALESGTRAEIALQAAAAGRKPRRPPLWRWPAWGLAGAGFACGVALTSAVLLLGGLPAGTGAGIDSEVVASHVRALMAEHLTDVASSDQHTVKPWFQGKLDYSPPVRDFAEEGYALVGGRLDYVSGRAVATLIYRRRSHYINVFVWPDAAEQGLQQTTRQGYNVLHWRHAGMQYWVVSDLNAAELDALAGLLH